MPRSSARRTILSLSPGGVRFPKFIAPSAIAGGSPGFLLGIVWVVVMALVLLPRFGRAHTVGVSVAELSVEPSGVVNARFMFASAEPLGMLLDRDHDGVVSGAEVFAARDDLKAFLQGGVDVTADGERCPASFGDATLTDLDGLVLPASYACPGDAAQIELTLYYLSGLPRGHRQIARIGAGSATAEAVLTGDHRALALRLPEDGRGGSLRGRRPRAVVALVAGVAVLVAWLVARVAWRRFKAS
jgi:hypothetical protein